VENQLAPAQQALSGGQQADAPPQPQFFEIETLVSAT